jgi:hypothetical protein
MMGSKVITAHAATPMPIRVAARTGWHTGSLWKTGGLAAPHPGRQKEATHEEAAETAESVCGLRRRVKFGMPIPIPACFAETSAVYPQQTRPRSKATMERSCAAAVFRGLDFSLVIPAKAGIHKGGTCSRKLQAKACTEETLHGLPPARK